MSMHAVWFLSALMMFIGGCGGWLLGYWRADRKCCTCCTCDDCAPIDDDWAGLTAGRTAYTSGLATMPDVVPGSVITDRRTWVLEPGPTIYPELAKLAAEDVSRPDDAPPGGTGPGHTTSTWLMERRLWMDAHYPIPAGT